MKRKTSAELAALNIALTNILAARTLLEQAGEPILALRLANVGVDSDIAIRRERTLGANDR